MGRRKVTIDGNEAAAYVAHRTNEVIAIYPITPSSPMAEHCDEWAAAGVKNIWGTVPSVTEMQSEAGAAAAVHGALQAGSLTTTFTASQGLLLMIPSMYKIAGELTPAVFHVSARTLATSALSIFGDHSDVMECRATGFALLASNGVQEVMDMALIAQAATLRGRVPVVHFFDGFRTSHEVAKVEELTVEDMRAMIPDDLVRAHRERALTPDRPVIRGTAMNPDVCFQAREAVNPYYDAFPEIVQGEMDRFAKLVGRAYRLYEYEGAPDAKRVIVIMGSGAETAADTARCLVEKGEKVGVLKVRLYRPFSARRFVEALPAAVERIAVLDRTKEPGAIGEPLYLDVVAAFAEVLAERGDLRRFPVVTGGRYGISSKEFTPAMVKGVFDELAKDRPKRHFTVGIEDDLTHLSLDYDRDFVLDGEGVFSGVFVGLGADGTVSANKNSIKIIGEGTDNDAQGYFVYDSRKSGSITISHLRFGQGRIRAPYLLEKAKFVACHQFVFMERFDVLKYAAEGATFLLNSPYGPEETWNRLPRRAQERIIRKKIRFYVIDAYGVAKSVGLGTRINTIMQTCYFKISGVVPMEYALREIKEAVEKTYGKKGEEIIRKNFQAIDEAVAKLHEVQVPAEATSAFEMVPPVPQEAPAFIREVTAKMIAYEGDDLPVSKIPADGTFPTGSARWEKRNVALEIPVWDPDTCIQCGKCSLVCPHAAIRMKAYPESALAGHPPTFKWTAIRGKELGDLKFTIQVAPEDCTGCGMCVHVCPAKNKKEARLKAINMAPQPPLREAERENYKFFLGLPELDRRLLKRDTVRGSQFLEPLFETSGACAGCGETPYLKLLSQLFGDRLLIGNATGCSSIYCGNLPTTPWSPNREGRGPAWSNSLFEDAAEFAFGFRLALDKQKGEAEELVDRLAPLVGADLAREILTARQKDEPEIFDQRARVERLKAKLKELGTPEARRLLDLADSLVKKSVWGIGGDGWAYDIGYGGLDHVLASGRDVNLLVLDTEVYSNTGGQMSKSTPRAAIAKFAAAGKPTPKKDLAVLAMTYGSVYVARVAMGASDAQTVRAFVEAERHEGPSLVIAYSHCIAHGINMTTGMDAQKMAVACGHWPLCRYDPGLAAEGKSPLRLDSGAPTIPFAEYSLREARYKFLEKSFPENFKRLSELAQKDVEARWKLYKQLAGLDVTNGAKKETVESGGAKRGE